MLLLLKIDFIDFSVEPLKRFRLSVLLFYAMLRIHFILMRIRIQDPHWKKMDYDPGQFLKTFSICLTKNNLPLSQGRQNFDDQRIRILNTDFKLLFVCAIQFDFLKFNNVHFYSVRFKKHRYDV